MILPAITSCTGLSARPSVRALPQIVQARERSHGWVRMCFVRVLESENARPQVVQAYGRSPVWVRLCRIRSLDLEKA